MLTSCGQKSQNNPQQQQLGDEQQSEKIPDQLKSIETNIEAIFKGFNAPSVSEEGAGDDQEKGGDGKQSGQSQKGAGDGEESTNKGGGSKEEAGGKENKEQPEQQKQPEAPKPPDNWEKISPVINSLHYQWNAYLPMSVKQGAAKQLADDFSTALNNLTNAIISKNQNNTLMAANRLYSYIPDFYYLYRTKTSPEIKRLRYYSRSAVLNAMTANWAQADTDINSLKASWSLFKNTVPKDQQELSSKLDFSLQELEKVVKEKNQPLVDIKGRVALSNVQEMEKALEQQSSQVQQK